MVKKMMVMVTCGLSDAERATIAFGMAYTAAKMSAETEVVVGLQSEGVWLAKKDLAEHIAVDGLPPLSQIIQGLMAEGGKILICEPCANARKLKQEDCMDNATIVGAGDLVAEVMSSDKTMVY